MNDVVVVCVCVWVVCELYECVKMCLELLFVCVGMLDGVVEGLRDLLEAFAKGKLECLAAARAFGNDKFKVGDCESVVEVYSEGLVNGGSDVLGVSLLFCNCVVCKLVSGKYEDAFVDANEALARCEMY